MYRNRISRSGPIQSNWLGQQALTLPIRVRFPVWEILLLNITYSFSGNEIISVLYISYSFDSNNLCGPTNYREFSVESKYAIIILINRRSNYLISGIYQSSYVKHRMKKSSSTLPIHEKCLMTVIMWCWKMDMILSDL